MKPETDIALIKQSIQNIEKSLVKLVEDSDKTESRVTILEQKQGIWAGVQGAFTLLVGAIAAYLGGKQ
jgi:hypothetical protein